MALIKSCVRFSQLRVFVGSALLICNVLFAQAQKPNKTPKTWEVGVGLGNTFIIPGIRKNDLVQRTLYSDLKTPYGNGDVLRVVGSHVQSLEFVLSYNLNQKSKIQFGYDQRFRLFRVLHNYPLVTLDDNGDLTFIYNTDIRARAGYYGHDKFIQRSTNIPITFIRKFYLNNLKRTSFYAGLGLSYYQSIRNQVIRKSPTSYGVSSLDFPIDGQRYYVRYDTKFVNSVNKNINGHLMMNYAVGVQHQFEKKNKLELNIALLDNFKTNSYYDNLEIEVNPRIQTRESNSEVIEQFDIGTKRFSLQQGGLMISLRYYPKPFNVNTNGVN